MNPSEPSHSNESAPGELAPTASYIGATRSSQRFRFSMRTMMIALFATSVWFAAGYNYWTLQRINSKLAGHYVLARELHIKDPTLIYAVLENPRFFDDKRWSVYVPRDGMLLCIQKSETATPPANSSLSYLDSRAEGVAKIPLSRGIHHVELWIQRGENQFYVEVIVDDQKAWVGQTQLLPGESFPMSSGVLGAQEESSSKSSLLLFMTESQVRSPNGASQRTGKDFRIWLDPDD